MDIPIARQSAGAGELVEGNDMDELISKRAVIEAIEKARANVGHNLERSIGKAIIEILDEVGKDVGMLPSAQPKRIRGRWIPVDSYSAFGGDEATWMAHGNPIAFYYCSECKKQAFAGEDGESLITDYCPNCGADMGDEEHGLQ